MRAGFLGVSLIALACSSTSENVVNGSGGAAGTGGSGAADGGGGQAGSTGGSAGASGGAGGATGGAGGATGGTGGTTGGTGGATGGTGGATGGTGGATGGTGGATGGTGGATGGTGGAGGACDPLKPFGTVTAVSNVNSSAYDDYGRLSADGLTLYFMSDRGAAHYDIWIATRTSVTSAFNAPTQLPGAVNSGSHEMSPSPSADELTLFFTADRATANDQDLYKATRTTKAQPFGNVTKLATPSSPSWDVQVFVSHDGTKLYFDSNRPSGDNDYNIYTTDSSGTQSAALLGDVNLTAYSDGAPVVSDDGNTLYFASDRPGGQGAKDIFVATWNSTAKKFQNPIVVQELNSTGFDKPTWLSPDGCVIYLSSTRTGGLGQSDLYMATRPK